jgi:SWI/SNF-related matrix-associated actin-dependent regulator of chromatin subfamily A containing DEAD/H box 1
MESSTAVSEMAVRPHETVETVPLTRMVEDSEDEATDTLATLPVLPTTQQNPSNRLTQPTQILDTRPAMPSSPSRPTVQVTASSPMQMPAPARKVSGVLAGSLMAPRGTFLARPQAPSRPPPQTITIDSDDEGPTYVGDSSDDNTPGSRTHQIKSTVFQRKHADSDSIPESPARGTQLFKSIVSDATYNGSSNGVKRSGDSLATAYGNASKKPRQTGPSRALPVSSQETLPDLDIDEIQNPDHRRKVRRMLSVFVRGNARECYEALQAQNGHFDDAVAYLLEMSERRAADNSKSKHVDLTGSDDELMPTPAVKRVNGNVVRPPPPLAVKQQARVPQRTIAEKWAGTQQLRAPQRSIAEKWSSQDRRPSDRSLNVFSPPPKQKRTLVRGRKNRSSPAPDEGGSTHIGRSVVLADDSDEDDSGIHSAPEDDEFGDRLLKFFNECTVADLVDTALIKPEYAQHIVSKRPFKSIDAISKIEAPDLKPTKQKRKANVSMGERVADKVSEMLESYEAVDYLVRKCEDMAKPLNAEIKSWGIKPKTDGELDIVSLRDSQRSGHDSGIGTPVSDDELKPFASKALLPQPAIMNHEFKMKDYQIVGMNWLNLLYSKRMSCILADDMGLGKTYQIIAFLAHLLETGDSGPHLVVVPSATLENWLKEFHRFCPVLVVEPYYSTVPGEREEMRLRLDDEKDDVNVIVTTYQLAKGKEDFPWLKQYGFRCAIFDEGHVLKNAQSQVSMKLNRIRSRTRLLLTGTPLQNNLRELISLLAFMMPDLFHERQDALKAIFNHSVKALDENHEALLSAQRIARARSMLTPFILRRKKYQVLKDLPKKDRRVEWCDLTPEQSVIYSSYLQKAFDIRDRRERGEEITNESTHILMKLRQAAIHPFLFRQIYKDAQLPKIAKQAVKDPQWANSNPDLIVTELLAYSDMELHTLCNKNEVLHKFALRNDEWLASGKFQKLLELVRRFIAEGSYILIFSQFVMVLDILELVLNHEQINYFRLDGSTKVSERQDLIDEFSNDENKTPVFMLSTKAGGAGINLAKANKVLVLDSGFNPQDDIQAENRAHRIGQVRDVEVIRLITRGTVEEQIYKMGLTKLKLDEEVAGVGEEEEGEAAKKKNANEETEKEAEGRMAVEDMFFKKLENKKEVLEEAKSPIKKGSQSQSQRQSPRKMKNEAESDDSQKTLMSDAADGTPTKIKSEEAHDDDDAIATRPKRKVKTKSPV